MRSLNDILADCRVAFSAHLIYNFQKGCAWNRGKEKNRRNTQKTIRNFSILCGEKSNKRAGQCGIITVQ